jgi:hypothetical protein
VSQQSQPAGELKVNFTPSLERTRDRRASFVADFLREVVLLRYELSGAPFA